MHFMCRHFNTLLNRTLRTANATISLDVGTFQSSGAERGSGAGKWRTKQRSTGNDRGLNDAVKHDINLAACYSVRLCQILCNSFVKYLYHVSAKVTYCIFVQTESVCCCCFLLTRQFETYDVDAGVFAAPPELGAVSPGFMIEREGATVELACEATGIPAPTLTWLKDGKELGQSARVSSSRGNRVVIKSVVVADAGVYTCLFKNPVAQVSHDIRVVVKGRPPVPSPSSIQWLRRRTCDSMVVSSISV